LDIDSSDTRSPIGCGYVQPWMKVSYHENMLRSCCHDLLCKHKLFLFPMHFDNQIVIFEVSSKNVNE